LAQRFCAENFRKFSKGPLRRRRKRRRTL
jgi:hypothetical protein